MQHAVACLRVGVFSGGAKHRSWGSLLTDQVGFLGAAAQRSRFYRSALNATAPPCATSDHAGTSGVEAKGFAVSSSLRGRPQEEDCRHGEWLEVVRTNDKFLFGRQDEGHAGNGCWFNHALGSGIFFNVGRTRLLYKKGSPGSLITEWLADGNGGAASSSSCGAHRVGAAASCRSLIRLRSDVPLAHYGELRTRRHPAVVYGIATSTRQLHAAA